MSSIAIETKKYTEFDAVNIAPDDALLLIRTNSGIKKITVADFKKDFAAACDIVDRTYKGTDLTVRYADEIANYTDAWAWFQARLDADNLSGIHVKDYIPFSISGENHKAQIAGIDTYYKTGSTAVDHHVDFISEDCYGTKHRYNATNTNQGNATTGSPFKASELYTWLNGTVYNALPAEIKAVIKEKYLYYPLRYASGSNLTDDNSWEFGSFGKLWLPLEGEIFDTPMWNTKNGYGNPYATQYPIFANDASARIKGAGPGGNSATWWTASAYSGGATTFANVGAYGIDSRDGATGELSVPLCFRLIAS